MIKGKVVVITGASSGIGEATAELLAAHGAKVVLGARREDRLQALVQQLKAAGGEAAYQVTDVTKQAEVKALVDLAQQRYGRVDVMFNNAGLMPLSPLNQLKVAEWERMIDVNIKGVLYGIAAVLPVMEAQNGGQIIATDSVAGHVTSEGSAVYCGTKYAVKAIIDGLRKEETDHHIRTMLISPGAVETELYATITDQAIHDATYQREREIGLKAVDIANAVAYAIDQPDNVGINEILIRPTAQKN